MSETPIWMPLLVASKAAEESVQETPACLKMRARAPRYSGKLILYSSVGNLAYFDVKPYLAGDPSEKSVLRLSWH